jgi:iron-sulfur cluster assembly accessory protein
MVQKAMHEEGLDAAALRVGVYGGGCAGLQYLLDFTERPSDTDFVFEHRGIKLVVDQFSAGHLRGTTINYVEGPAATGFKFDNPNLVRSCGCGLAF